MVDYSDDFDVDWAIKNFVECAGEDIKYFTTIDKTEFRNALKLAKCRDELKRSKNMGPYCWQLLHPKNLGGRKRTSMRERK